MSTPQALLDTQLQHLKDARAIVLKQPDYWPQVLTTSMGMVTSTNSLIEVRRWCADFLAESFSTPMIDLSAKQELAITCLDGLLQLSEETEAGILKSVVQCSASVYPIVFRHICSNRNAADTWNKMTTLKSRILGLWDSAPIGVRLCCIKFVQRVVLAQSRGVTDPRLVDRTETSLATVPTNHPLLNLQSLDAEAQGLLDRLLSILQEDPSEPTLVTAALNNLGPIIKTRPPIAGKVLGAAMNFNPFTKKPLNVQTRLMMLSMEKTIRVLLLNICRSNPQGPYVPRITQHLNQLSRAKAEMNEEMSRKRAASTQDHDAKRVKVERPMVRPVPTPTPTATPPPPPPVLPTQQVITGPMSYAQLYTLATDPAMANFDGKQLPLDLVLQIVIGSLYSLNASNLTTAITAIRDRYTALLGATVNAPSASLPLGTAAPIKKEPDELHLTLGEFTLPPPPPLTPAQLQIASTDSMNRMFSVMEDLKKTSLTGRDSKLGVGRLAASNWDREGWTSILIRLATRSATEPEPSALATTPPPMGTEVALAGAGTPTSFPDSIRERLFAYIIGDFRGRMDVAVAWLNEEWYNDRILAENDTPHAPQYHKWMMRIMDAIFPFLEVKDRVFMRMLSEIPEITQELLEKVKTLCLDPDRAGLGIQMLHYLALLRPPVREEVLDVLEDLWGNHADVKEQAEKLLAKWRPAALEVKEEEKPETPQQGEQVDEHAAPEEAEQEMKEASAESEQQEDAGSDTKMEGVTAAEA